MNEELKKLLKQINDKKNEVRSLASEGKIEKAKEAKAELKALQDKFEILCDLEEEQREEIEDSVKNGTAKAIGDKKPGKKDIVSSFVNIIKAGFLQYEPDEADVKVYKDALTSDTTPNEEGQKGIGVTIPEDIRTDIIELRRSSDNLEQYVNVEGVTTKSGSRNIEVDAESVPFDNVEEAADFPEMDDPVFEQIEYKIKKKGGILKMTAELLEDTAVNIMAYISKWIAKKTKATRNAMILKVLNEMTAGKEIVVSNMDSLKDIFNVELDPAIAATSIVIANQNGFNYLDKLKDKDGNYILQKDPTLQTKGKLLFGEYPIVKLSKKTMKSKAIYNPEFGTASSHLKIDGQETTISASSGESDVQAWSVNDKGYYVVKVSNTEHETKVKATVEGYKHPIFCGDLKEAITLFDRNVMTIDLNDKGPGMWEKDMTGIKVRDRFDVRAVDKGAVIKGEITEVVSG